MFNVKYTKTFIKKLTKLEDSLIYEIKDKIELLKDKKNHKKLKVHKLHGRLKGAYSFYVNYKIRVVFEYLSKTEIILEDVGPHDGVY
jgi:toxin HigB-1